MNIKNFKQLPKVVAIDFDGIITVEDRFPDIGELNLNVIKELKSLQDLGVKLILWTCRVDCPDRPYLSEAVNICAENGLTFNTVNDNIEEVKNILEGDSRKVYADVYLDDRACQRMSFTQMIDLIKNSVR